MKGILVTKMLSILETIIFIGLGYGLAWLFMSGTLSV